MESIAILLETEQDIVIARSEVRSMAAAMGFRLADQTRLATVASELARNVVKYAGRGRLIAQPLFDADGRSGLRLIFEDQGPGIADIEAAMRDGYSTGGGLGKGLPGSRRLVDEFRIESHVGRGTRVTVIRWL
ncbi:anti-sigma regulatory factor [Pyrinomonas sp.]|uniref:anti-sigma regulatory factor n=1 Tax=Pyrinomonas sp. TaxID=2080306 RepID=UPI0033300433